MTGATSARWSFTVTANEPDWRSANWLLTRDRWLWRRLLRMWVAVWLVFVIVLAGPDIVLDGWRHAPLVTDVVVGTALPLVMVALIVATHAALLPWRTRRRFREATTLPRDTACTIDADGFHTVDAISTTSLPWPIFTGWLENDRVLIPIVTPRVFFVVPKAQAGPEATAAMRQALMDAGVPKR